MQLLILMFLLMLFMMIGVAFVTLFERKLLGYSQLRLGPSKLGVVGILQPVSDGVKLFLKEKAKVFISNKILFEIFPFIFLLLMMIMWLLYNFYLQEVNLQSMMIFILISGLSVFNFFISGWSSNSKYALLGCYRSVAQTVSYEVSMVFMLLCLFIFLNCLNLSRFVQLMDKNIMYLMLYSFMFIMWIVISLAELNRAPFDFAESESELVSGFNVEYGGSKFALFFLAEYGSLIFISYLSMKLFLGEFMMLLVIFFIILVRAVYPRYRYDNLMYLNWKVFLPLILIMFMKLYYMNYTCV